VSNVEVPQGAFMAMLNVKKSEKNSRNSNSPLQTKKNHVPVSNVEVPQKAFMAMLNLEESEKEYWE